MNQYNCAGNRNLSESLARLPRILPYCSRPVTIAFVYARCCLLIPLGKSESPRSLWREFAFGERVAR
jgi:hypothetical protein